jgi:plasmid stabilization system protein ParE
MSIGAGFRPISATAEQFHCQRFAASTAASRLIPFGNSGYVALYEIVSASKVVVLAVRHQREEDYH